MGSEARWWTKDGASVRCVLCPHLCRLAVGETGLCGVRSGDKDGLALPGYGYVTAEASDPIEKKPLYHFLPGRSVWSVGFAGCNLDCPFCQNHAIARAPAGAGKFRFPEETVDMAVARGSSMIAYTYSEPTVHFEYVVETARIAAGRGLKNILVTNGCVNPGPAAELLPLMDGVNIDVKSWSRRYYEETLRGNLDTVLKFAETAVGNCWVELTTLVVPADNDGEADIAGMCSWIASLSEEIPLHLSAYHPSYRYGRASTDSETMARLTKVASEFLPYVYVGNLGWENDTICPECGEVVVERSFYATRCRVSGNACPDCGARIPGVFAG